MDQKDPIWRSRMTKEQWYRNDANIEQLKAILASLEPALSVLENLGIPMEASRGVEYPAKTDPTSRSYNDCFRGGWYSCIQTLRNLAVKQPPKPDIEALEPWQHAQPDPSNLSP